MVKENEVQENQEQKSAEPLKFECENCGKEFFLTEEAAPSHKDIRFCSDECAEMNARMEQSDDDKPPEDYIDEEDNPEDLSGADDDEYNPDDDEGYDDEDYEDEYEDEDEYIDDLVEDDEDEDE